MRKHDELNDPTSCLNRAADDEMIFVLLGRDLAAATAIRAWVLERVRLRKNAPTDAQIIEAISCAAQMLRSSEKATPPNGEAFILAKTSLVLAEEIDCEVARSERHGAHFASLHEAYAVILEELDEIRDIARMKRCDRDRDAIRKELIQIAAMAIKGVQSLDNFVGGSV